MMIGTTDVEGGLYKFKSKIQYNFVAYPSIAVISCGIIGLAIPLMIGCFFSSNNILFWMLIKLLYLMLVTKLNSNYHASVPFALLHVDIWGPCAITSLYGHKYFLTIIDDNTQIFWVFPMISKVETQTQLKSFVAYVERQFKTKVKAIRSDNGSEFIMSQFYASTWIVHQTSYVETP